MNIRTQQQHQLVDEILRLVQQLQDTATDTGGHHPVEILLLIGTHEHEFDDKGKVISHENCRTIVASSGRKEGLAGGLIMAINQNPGLADVVLMVSKKLVELFANP